MKFKMLIAATALALTAACATSATGPAATDRFDSFSYAAGEVDLSSYEQVYVAPVTVSEAVEKLIDYRPIGSRDNKRPLNTKIIEEKSDDLADDLTEALGSVKTLVDAQGQGVLTVSAVITKLEANRPTMADLQAEPSLSTQSTYAGAVHVEVTFSENGKVLATAKDGDVPSLNDTLLPAPLWSTVNKAFNRLANKVADLLS